MTTEKSRTIYLLLFSVLSRVRFFVGRFSPRKIVFTSVIFGFSGLMFSNVAVALAVAQGYQTMDSSLLPGMAVTLSRDSTPQKLIVEPATSATDRIPLGVVVDRSDSLIAVGSSLSDVFIAESGQTDVFVSDLNGEVKKGDILVASPLKGVLQKAGSESQYSVAVALEDLSGRDLQETKVMAGGDKKVTTSFALMNVNVDIKAYNAEEASDNWLQSIGYTITGRSVNELRVLTALVVFLALLAVETALVHGTVTSTISATGRNPLAKFMIERQSIKGVLMAMMVLLVGVASIAGILWV